jgi:hypothetical protein
MRGFCVSLVLCSSQFQGCMVCPRGHWSIASNGLEGGLSAGVVKEGEADSIAPPEGRVG